MWYYNNKIFPLPKPQISVSMSLIYMCSIERQAIHSVYRLVVTIGEEVLICIYSFADIPCYAATLLKT